MATQDHINEQLKVLLAEDLKVISYKWLARKFGLPCNLAKQTLFSFLEQHRGKVKATYLLAGWTSTEPRQHTVQLVDSEHLSTRRSGLDPVTSMHVYSLQPAQPKDASELWNHDAIQTAELFQELRLGQTNCLADNRWSAVKCREAKHDPSLAKRAPKPAAEPSDASAAGPSKPAKKPAPGSAAGQIAGIMAGSAKQAGVAAASVAVKGSGAFSIADSQEPAVQEQESGTTATAPSGAHPLSGPASGGPSAAPTQGGRKKGDKSRLANMWSKAPAVKEKPAKASTSKAQAVPAVDADAAIRSAQQAGSSSDSDEEDFLPMKRTAQQRNKRIEEEEEDAEDGPSGGGSHRQSKKAKVSDTGKAAASDRPSQPALQECEDEEASPVKKPPAKPKSKAAAASSKKKTAAAPKKPAAKRAPAKKAAAKQVQSDKEISDADIEVTLEEEEQQQETQGEPELTQDEQADAPQSGRGKKGSKRAAANKPGPGSVKAGALTGGPKRRKVMRTSINDKGEEVSEEVWEDTQPASASQEAADGSVAAKPQDSPAGSPVKASEDDALKEQPGKSGAAKPSKPKPAAPAANRGSGKSSAKDQRGIMSFFAKK